MKPLFVGSGTGKPVVLSFCKSGWTFLGVTLIAIGVTTDAMSQVSVGHRSHPVAAGTFLDEICGPCGQDLRRVGKRRRFGRPSGTLTTFLGIDGSKQPQDFGANANLGVASQIGYAGPILPKYGIGFQIGTRASFTGNAVQVFELLGESVDRFQSFTTVGLFRRSERGIGIGFAYDYLSQKSFDDFTLGQWRLRGSYDLTDKDEVGVTVNLSDRRDSGRFNIQDIELEPIEQLHIYMRRRWKSGVNTSFWIGVADKHSEENAITGTLPPKTNQVLFGAEIFAPLNHFLAIYGETNLIMPADTGAVDAYLGMQFAPRGIRRSQSRQNRFREFVPVASNPTFTNDLTRR